MSITKLPVWHIALISSSILVLELAFIRLIPAEVRAISYFTNLILIAAFFGLGLGCICQKQRSLSWALPLGMVLVFLFIIVGRGIVIYEEAETVHYWFKNPNVKGQAHQLPLFQAAAIIFIFSAMPFIAMGQVLARAMDQYPRLIAYGWDIAGSLAGTVIFVVSSILSIPPWVWPPFLMLVWSVFLIRASLNQVLFLLSGLLFIFLSVSPYPAKWSPYYYIQHELVQDRGIRVWVNSSFHQYGIDFKSKHPSSLKKQASVLQKWNYPYQIYRDVNGTSPKKVLILGSGTGNDVNVALFNRAEEITAVEIDPVIISLGMRHNSYNPYGDKRVKTVVDDGRHYLRTAKEKYDLILFGTLDSQTLLSGQSNLRLESYVYTKESLDDARTLLNDRGVFGIYYSVYKPWLYKRLYATVRATYGEHTRIEIFKDNFLFNTVIVGAKGAPEFRDEDKMVQAYGQGLTVSDDWPFIYLEYPTIAPVYTKLFGVVLILIICVFFLLRRLHPITGLHVNYLALGMGFTLMESSAIVRLSLVFGNTWSVNAVVFGSVLLMIFLANFAVMKKIAPTLRFAWIGLVLFVLINYLFPIQMLFEVDVAARVALSLLLIGTPVFFAAVCFSTLFEKEVVTGYPLGINLIGAMAGGIIEYASMMTGLRSVWLIVLGIYLLAWISTKIFNDQNRTPVHVQNL